MAGPWTLGVGIYLYRGERALADPGAARDLSQSLAEGIRVHLAEVQRLVPGATLVLQVDEPSLPAVQAGLTPAGARDVQRSAAEVARELSERAES